MNWIIKQSKGSITCINDVPIFKNPFRHRHEYISYEFPDNRVPQDLSIGIQKESKGNWSQKDYLIYSYEDHSLPKITHNKYELKHDLYVGKSLKRYDVLILRDPFNLLASRFKSNFYSTKDYRKEFVELWLEYAKEFIGETNYLKENKVCINYNHWFFDSDYRKDIFKSLDLDVLDIGLGNVSFMGGGSSFDKLEYANSADSMKVLNRWEKYLKNQKYLKELSNQDVLEYSEKIFGKIPGTEILYN